MAIKNIEIQDSDGNIYYPHTNASVVNNGSTTVAEQLKEIANDSYPIVEGTGTNTYIGSTARITKLSKGTRCTLFVGTNATGNCNLNLNNYGAKNIKDSFGNIVNNIKANIPYNLCYNGSDFILQGKGGGGNATADKLLSGSTATVDSGPITGTMPNQGIKTATLNCGGSYIIPTGYHNGSGKVTANSLASQTPGNAAAAQILNGFSAWVNGNKINGNATIGSLGGYSVQELTEKIYFQITKESGNYNNFYYYVYLPDKFNSGVVLLTPIKDKNSCFQGNGLLTYLLNFNGITIKTFINEDNRNNISSTSGSWGGNRMYISIGKTTSDLIKNDEFTGETCKMIIISKN